MEEFVANNSRWKCALLLFVSLIGIIFFVWTAGLLDPQSMPERQYSKLDMVVALFGALASAQLALRSALRWWNDKDYLVIGRQGIRFVGWSDELIPWKVIEDISTRDFRGYRIIILGLKQPHRFRRRGLIGKLGWLDGLIVRGKIDISLLGADRSLDEAMVAIRNFSPIDQDTIPSDKAAGAHPSIS